ncbi:MAG: hypothetical protein P8Y24_01000, partial [Gammaproteobacteria bacterium]
SIDAFVSGSFFLVKAEELTSGSPPHPLVRKFQIFPEFDDKNKQTGIFNIKIEFGVEVGEQEKPEACIISDLARDILDYYLNLLTFLSGSEIKKVKPIDLKYKFPKENRFRAILYESESANLVPPVPLSQTYLFKEPIDSRLSRCLAFYAYGIREKDIVISISFLLSALDMLSAQFKINEKIIRECEKCGYRKELEAGIAAKMKYVITDVAGYSEDEYKDIWEIRNSIFHGYIEISAENVRKILDKRSIVRISIIRAMKIMIGLNKDDLPLENDPNWFADPVLDVEYVPNN